MAKRKEVLLVQDVLKLGNMGDIVRVSPGFARNYLFPYAMAIPAGAAAKRQIEVLREKAAKSEADREAKAIALKKGMEGMTIQLAARVAHDTELFGSIGTREIVAALAKSGIEVDPKQVHLHDKLKRLGVYNVEIRLHKSVPVNIKLEIINIDPNAPALSETLANAGKEKAEKEAAAEADGDEKPEAGKEAGDGKKGKKAKEAKAAEGESAKGDKADKADKKARGDDKNKKSENGRKPVPV
jgi:large subunit ribosomal protein L9